MEREQTVIPQQVVAQEGAQSEPPCFLYRHFDADDRLLYVGISLSALTRLSQHRENAHWFALIRRVAIELHPTRRAALEAERDAIRRERPIHNVWRPSVREQEEADAYSPRAASRQDLLRRIVQFNPVYSREEASQVLGISTGSLKALLDAGKIGHVQIGSKIKHTGWQLIEFLEAAERGIVKS